MILLTTFCNEMTLVDNALACFKQSSLFLFFDCDNVSLSAYEFQKSLKSLYSLQIRLKLFTDFNVHCVARIIIVIFFFARHNDTFMKINALISAI